MVEIVLGPPGTGKTTTLLSVVDEELARGVAPDRIGYVTFTRRGAEEAVSRACTKFKLEPKQLPWFRTLHSLCFRQLGLRSADVLEGPRMRAFGQYAGIKISGRGMSEDGTLTGYDTGDRVMFMENLSRVRGIPLRQAYDRADDDLPWSEVQRVARALVRFKAAHGLVDYTDMLSQFVREKINLRLDVLVVDEAQDLSALQWRVVDLLSTGARRVVVAGDDDQAIYRWAGADVDHLIDMRGDARVLGQSYRVPPAVQRVAGGIIDRVRRRRAKPWEARTGSRGAVAHANQFGQVDCSGEVLVLVRNTYVLREHVEPELRRRGVVYERHGRSSISPDLLEDIVNWERLRKGGTIGVEAARRVYEHMSSTTRVTRGFKRLPNLADDAVVSLIDLQKNGGLLTDAVWHDAMDRVPADDVSYIMAARRHGEKLSKRPRVRLSTIHGSKGGEADHVVLMKEMAWRSHREMRVTPDDEARVWYVGATRARERLTIVESSTKLACPWI